MLQCTTIDHSWASDYKNRKYFNSGNQAKGHEDKRSFGKKTSGR